MEIFTIQKLIREQAAGERPYLEFLSIESMSFGLYVLPAGGLEPLRPHVVDAGY